MLIFNYASKKDLKAAIGQKLRYRETSLHGLEFKADGKVYGSNRPSINSAIPKGSREFFAEVTMAAGLIAKVA